MLLRGPAQDEFLHIFERVCDKHNLTFDIEVIERFIEKHYRTTGKVFRRCHPRDLLSHTLNLINFEKLPLELTAGVLERAFDSCFLAEDENAAVPATAIVRPKPAKPCSEFVAERMAQVATVFGRLAWAASFRDRANNVYHYTEAGREYAPAEVNACMASLHAQVFRDWLGMSLENQSRDLVRYLSTAEGRAAFLSFDRKELAAMLAPGTAMPQEIDLFRNDMTTVVQTLSQRSAPEPQAAPSLVAQIA